MGNPKPETCSTLWRSSRSSSNLSCQQRVWMTFCTLKLPAVPYQRWAWPKMKTPSSFFGCEGRWKTCSVKSLRNSRHSLPNLENTIKYLQIPRKFPGYSLNTRGTLNIPRNHVLVGKFSGWPPWLADAPAPTPPATRNGQAMGIHGRSRNPCEQCEPKNLYRHTYVYI